MLTLNIVFLVAFVAAIRYRRSFTVQWYYMPLRADFSVALTFACLAIVTTGNVVLALQRHPEFTESLGRAMLYFLKHF